MRKTLRYLFLCVFAAVVSAAFFACGGLEEATPSGTPADTPVNPPAAETYIIAFSAEDEAYGSVSCKDASGAAVESGAKFEKNAALTLTATPNAGYSFSGWFKSSDKVLDDAEYSFTMPESNLTLVAKFTVNSYAFSYSSIDAEKGTVSCDIASGTDVNYKQGVTITATSNVGYDFAGWSDGREIVSTDAEYSFYMPASALVLEAQFIAQKRTVNFYVDSAIYQTEEVDYNTPAPTADVIPDEKAGYEFNNWFTDPDFDNVYGGEAVTKTLNLYAKFDATIVLFTVRFFDYDGSKISGDQSIEQGENVKNMPSDPERTGYDFVGWTFNDNILGDDFTVAGDMDIYASYNVKKYDVRFFDGDDEIVGYSQRIEHGKTAAIPATLVKADSVFEKWLLDNEFDFDFGTEITGDVNLYAKWKAAEKAIYTVKFYDGDLLKDTQPVEEGGYATAPQSPYKTGYKFVRWELSGGAEFDFDAPITANLNVYAAYETAKCEITFVYYSAAQNKNAESKITVNYGTDATSLAPTDTDKTGYTFGGWDKAFDNVVEDIKVTAVYTVKTFTATFRLQGEIYGAVQTVNYGETFVIPDTPSVAGYSFMGWFTSDAFTAAFDFTLSATADVTVFGKLDEIVIKTYTVTFKDDNGRTVSEQTVVEHEAASAPGNPSKTGYTFRCWDKPFGDITEDLTVNAVYDVNQYTVRYYQADGETLIDSRQVDYGGDASGLVEAPKITGKYFLRWSKDISSVEKDVDVYAIYANNVVTVKFMDEDGTTVICTQPVEYGGHASIPDTPTKASCIFKAWVVANNSDEVFNFNTVITAETEIYAKWENVSGIYSVYFKDYDGNPYGNVQRIVAGFTVEEPSAPVKAGVTFDGWYVEGTDDKFDFATVITKTITLVARAEEVD